ncbi:trypsin-like peptidase domain-containing protein [Patescibacteria group bacterium]|nr:trypsin-like peptidase domain-containing protein [Patescibacteria group bacterium]
MPLFLQNILIIIAGFFVALLGVFGFGTEQATAPSERMPAIIAESEIERPVEEPRAPEVPTASETPKPQTEEPKKTTPTTPPPATPASATVPKEVTPTPPPIPTPAIAPATLNETVRKSVVNIFCTSLFGGPFNAISASGVIVDPRGVILTNAHVAQYFLLRDYPAANTLSCIIRTGAPAIATYTAELLFLPPSWIQENADKIHDENPLGTGEHDYALVRITGTTNPQNTLPASFPYLPITTTLPKLDDDILVVGYPAGFIDGITLQRGLYQTSAFTKVRELLTFLESTLDLFSIGGSVVAQSGASGGAATNTAGELMGIVVTSTQAPDTASRDLRAITMSYLVRDFQNEAGESFTSYLLGNLSEKAQIFRNTKEPALIEMLTSAVESTQAN